jgi:CDP-diacylglycerol--serine O-phosphatidyltransferase
LKKHVPNIFTCLNLFSGCIALVMVFRDRLDVAAYLVYIAVLFDFMDGMAARLLNVHSAMGKELDSLADVITFGLVPGTVLFSLLGKSDLSLMYVSDNFRPIFLFFPFIVTVFSAIRLAKFNIDTRQTESFIGLPTPANTLLIASLPLILQHDTFHLASLILNPYFLVIATIVLSYLLVAELPLFALKFKTFEWKKNKYQYILLASAVILILVFYYVAIPLIVLLYLFLSLIRNLSNINRKPITPKTVN